MMWLIVDSLRLKKITVYILTLNKYRYHYREKKEIPVSIHIIAVLYPHTMCLSLSLYVRYRYLYREIAGPILLDLNFDSKHTHTLYVDLFEKLNSPNNDVGWLVITQQQHTSHQPFFSFIYLILPTTKYTKQTNKQYYLHTSFTSNFFCWKCYFGHFFSCFSFEISSIPFYSEQVFLK